MYAGNLHVYYLIKRSGYNINDINRRICISITKSEEENNVSIDLKGGATVNAKNESIGSEEEINDIVKNQTIIDTIKAHALTKKATSIPEMSSKATLEIVKQDEENLKDDKDSRNNQIAIYLKYTKDLEAIEYIIQKYKNEYVFDADFDEISLPLKIFEREDIESLDKEIDVINKFLTLYSDDLEALHDVWRTAIYSGSEFGSPGMVSKDTNLRKRLLKFSIESIKNKSEKQNPYAEFIGYYDNLVGNKILDSLFLKWYLDYFYDMELPKNYKLKIFDKNINMFDLNKNEYVVLKKDGYKIENEI